MSGQRAGRARAVTSVSARGWTGRPAVIWGKLEPAPGIGLEPAAGIGQSWART